MTGATSFVFVATCKAPRAGSFSVNHQQLLKVPGTLSTWLDVTKRFYGFFEMHRSLDECIVESKEGGPESPLSIQRL
jgi:hypothetical protein